MRKFIIVVILSCFIGACSNDESTNNSTHNHDSSTKALNKDVSRKSVPSESVKFLANTHVKINYHSPGVRGRVIWGGLVPYDQVWVTGAHSATTIEVGKDFQVGEKTIPAGKYAIFTIPGKEFWTVIINKNWNQHLADDYSENEDIVRTTVKPRPTDEVVERLKYEINQTGERTANIVISWEKLKVPFHIEIR